MHRWPAAACDGGHCSEVSGECRGLSARQHRVYTRAVGAMHLLQALVDGVGTVVDPAATNLGLIVDL